jgi:ABC-type uncharacterized transport system ATPase subunit
MKAQTPAEGILKTNDWGDSRAYHVVCECGSADCSHNLWVEADDSGVAVIIMSHNLQDVFKVADDIAVLYLGKMVANLQAKDTNHLDVVQYITGTRTMGDQA